MTSPSVDLQLIVVGIFTAILLASWQRAAWEVGQKTGIITTSFLILAGLALQAISDQPLLHQIGQAIALSGFVVAGWTGTEKYLFPRFPRGRMRLMDLLSQRTRPDWPPSSDDQVQPNTPKPKQPVETSPDA